MASITVNFLHLFFFLLSLGALGRRDQGAPITGAKAAPFLPSGVTPSPSRRGSVAVDGGVGPDGASTPERRGSALADRRLNSISTPSGRRLSSASITSDRRRGSVSNTPGRRTSSISIQPEHRVASLSAASGRRMSSFSGPSDLRRTALGGGATDVRRMPSSSLLSSFARDINSQNGDDDDDDEDDDDDDDPDSSIVHFPIIKGRDHDGSQGISLGLQQLESKEGAHPQMLLQHHLNTANAKLARMKNLDPFTEADRIQALQRRRASILEDVQHAALPESRKVHAGRFGFAPAFHPGGSSSQKVDVEEPSRRSFDFEEQDPLTPNAAPRSDPFETPTIVPRNDPFDMRAEDETSEILLRAEDEEQAIADEDQTESSEQDDTAPPLVASTSHLDKVKRASKTSTYNIAKLGFPKAALKASNSDVLMKAKKPSHDGSLGLAIEANDIGYIANVTIGGAGTFKMLIDSGSADTWVASTSCSDCGDAHKALGKSTSSTYKSVTPQQNFSIRYGTGSLSGYLAKDTLQIANYTLKNKALGVATQQSTDFSSPDTPFDGLMGFANRALASTGAATPIDVMFSRGLVSQPVMGYHLGRSSDLKKNNDGEVTFGGVDGDKYKGSLTVIENQSTQGFWEANITEITFGGKTIKLSGTYGRSAILDTGTTLIIAPPADAAALHKAIPGSKSDGNGGYTIPCTTSKSVAFEIGGKSWKIDPRDMLFLPVDSNDLTGDCISSVSAGNVGTAGEWLFGAAFLKNVYFATNAKSNTLALGELAEDDD